MGKILNISNSEYQAIEAMSFSALKEFIKSPAHYKAYKEKPYEGPSPAQLIGTLVHSAVLEPDSFESKFVVVNGHRGSKSVKEAIEHYSSLGMQSVTTEQMSAAQFARDAVLTHPVVKELMVHGAAEQSIITKDPESGAPIKCRPDYFIEEAGVLLDLKTFSDLTTRSIERQIIQQKYHLQSAHYLHTVGTYLGKPLKLFGNIFVEVEAPFGVRFVGLSDASLEKAFTNFHYYEQLQRYADCLETGIWNNYDPAPVTIELFN